MMARAKTVALHVPGTSGGSDYKKNWKLSYFEDTFTLHKF